MLGYVPLNCLTDVEELKVSVVAGEKADSRTILYDAPNNRAKEIMSVKNGTACFNLFGRKEGEWRRVRVGGVSGWIKYTQTSSLFALTDRQSRNTVPYYPLLMQAKDDVLLCSEMENMAKPYMTLGKDMKVELLAECGEYAYVRTLEGGAGAYDCGDFGYVKISELSLAQVGESIGVAQVDNDDVPVIMLKTPEADAEMIGALCPGAQVRIIEYTQTDYVQVALGELRGCIPKDEIRVLSQQGDRASQRIPQRATLLADTLMKNTPSGKTRDGQTISKGEKVYMLGSFGDWAFVQRCNGSNWIYQEVRSECASRNDPSDGICQYGQGESALPRQQHGGWNYRQGAHWRAASRCRLWQKLVDRRHAQGNTRLYHDEIP